MFTANLHDCAIVGVSALVFACIPFAIGYGPAIICIGISLTFIVVICLSAYTVNRTATQVSGFAQPDTRSCSSLDATSLRSSSSILCSTEGGDEEAESEFFNVNTLRRSVAACFSTFKPRRGRLLSDDSTLSVQSDPGPSLPRDDTPSLTVSEDLEPPVATPIATRPRAMTLPVQPRDRAPSFSGFAFPPREQEVNREPEPEPISEPMSTPPQTQARPKLSVRIPSALRLGTLRVSDKPSPSPTTMSPCVRSPSVKSHPLRRCLRSLRGKSTRSKREDGVSLEEFDDLDLGPLERSTSVKGGGATRRHDVYADLMVRCVTVAA